MGTSWSVALIPGDSQDIAALSADIKTTISEIENRYSTYLADSEVKRFNTEATTDWIPVSAALCDAFTKALALSRFTDGSFDISVAPLVDAWGFGPGEDVYEPLTEDKVAALLERVGFGKLAVDCDVPAVRKSVPDLEVDFSAWAKGHAIDRVAEYLDARGHDRYLVELGGEIRTSGLSPSGKDWSIAVADPDAPGRPLPLRVAMQRAAMATSGDYANFFTANGRRYAHVIDPRTGVPTGHALTAVTVIDKTAARADALATALLVLGPDDAIAFATRHDIAASFLIRGDDEITRRSTPAFEAYVASDEVN